MNGRTRIVCGLLVGVIICGFGVAKGAGFSWADKEGEYLDLLFGGRKVTRYMYAYDTSSEQRVFETYKVLHHVFDEEGKNLLTNGPDGDGPYSKGIKFPHHRGIFIGWNRLECGGQSYDTWHMSRGVAQVHQKFLEQKAGPTQASSAALIHWKSGEGKVMVEEKRCTTVYRPSGETILLLDFETELKAVGGEVYLNGDPEHAGFQYRAHNDVATGGADVKAKYLFYKEGIEKRVKSHEEKDMPWVGMEYGLNGKRYSVQCMNHPSNPKGTVYSAYRDYGRFGAFFKHTIPAGQTLKLRYRIWVGEGALPERAELASRYSTFIAE